MNLTEAEKLRLTKIIKSGDLKLKEKNADKKKSFSKQVQLLVLPLLSSAIILSFRM